VLGVLGEELIDLRLVLLAAPHQRLGERLGGGVNRVARPELGLLRGGVVHLVQVELVEELQRDFPSLSPLSHVSPRSA